MDRIPPTHIIVLTGGRTTEGDRLIRKLTTRRPIHRRDQDLIMVHAVYFAELAEGGRSWLENISPLPLRTWNCESEVRAQIFEIFEMLGEYDTHFNIGSVYFYIYTYERYLQALSPYARTSAKHLLDFDGNKEVYKHGL